MFWPETHRYFYGNEEALRRSGNTFEEFLEHGPIDTNPSLTREIFQKRLNELILGDSQSTIYETEHYLADGSILPVEVNLQYIEPKYHRPYFLATIRDLTLSKAADKAKSEFVATVSHELRTPLTSIKGSLGLVRTGAMGELPDKPKAMIEIAYNNCERLVRLINDILDIEKIEAGKMDGVSTWGEIKDILIPLAWGGIASTALLTFIFCWNEAYWTVRLTTIDAATLSKLIEGNRAPEGLFFGRLSAVSTAAVGPIVVLGWFCQKQLVQGLTFGAVK